MNNGDLKLLGDSVVFETIFIQFTTIISLPYGWRRPA